MMGLLLLAFLCPRIEPVVDGELGEWASFPAVELGEGQVVILDERRFRWAGPADLSAKVWLGWSGKGLCLAARVWDDLFSQDFEGERIWLGDSVQIALDPLLDGGESGYGPDDSEYGLALTKSGPVVWRHHAQEGRKEGKVRAEVAIRRLPDGLSYEALIPWGEVRPLSPALGEFGVSVIVNDNDGKGRKGWVEWTPGIGFAPKSPGKFARAAFDLRPPGEGVEVYASVMGFKFDDNEEAQVRVCALSAGDLGECRVVAEIPGLARAERGTRIVKGRNFVGLSLPTGVGMGRRPLLVRIVKGGEEMASTEAEVRKVSSSVLRRRIEGLRARLPELERLLEEGRRRGVDLSYQRLAWVVVADFLRYSEMDIEEKHPERAEENLPFLEALFERALREAKEILGRPERQLRVPRPDMSRVEVREGAFYADGIPVVLVGSLCWGEFAEALPRLQDYGFNFGEFERGPWHILTGPEKGVNEAEILAVLDTLDRAEKANVAVDFLAHPHYFPLWWAEKVSPATPLSLFGGDGGFIKFCIEEPAARDILSAYYNALIPAIVGHPALHSLILANEPVYLSYSDHYVKMFRDWLRARHGSVEALNLRWGTKFREFSEIGPAREPTVRGHFNDWCLFNQEFFASRLFGWLVRLVSKYDPKIPLHIKVMNWCNFSEGGMKLGIDRELLSRWGERGISGCDGAITPSKGPYALNFHEQLMGYDLMRSIAPERPVVDSEWHYRYGDPFEYPPRCAYSSLWLSALHGALGMNIWVWGRSENFFLDGSVLYNAKILYQMGRAALDMRRLARYVAAFSNLRGEAAILYSPASRSGCRFNSETRKVWEALNFLGVPTKFVTERQVEGGGLDKYRLLIVPAAKFVPEGAFRGIVKWVRRGGILLATPEALRCDFWGRERGEAAGLLGVAFLGDRELEGPLPFGTPLSLRSPAWDGRIEGQGVLEEVVPTTAKVLASSGGRPLVTANRVGDGTCFYIATFLGPKDYAEILDHLLSMAGARPPFRLLGPDGRAAWGVEWRASKVEGRWHVYLVNLSVEPREVRLLGPSGGVKVGLDLITMEQVRFPLKLEPLEVRLLRL